MGGDTRRVHAVTIHEAVRSELQGLKVGSLRLRFEIIATLTLSQQLGDGFCFDSDLLIADTAGE